jgi:hypothetical protein
MEALLSLKITVELETNKDSIREVFEQGEQESRSELLARIREWLEEE